LTDSFCNAAPAGSHLNKDQRRALLRFDRFDQKKISKTGEEMKARLKAAIDDWEKRN